MLPMLQGTVTAASRRLARGGDASVTPLVVDSSVPEQPGGIMSTESTAQTSEPSAECGTSVEGLACVAKRFEKQSEVAKESFEKLAEYKAKFDTARADYQKARDDVAADVEAAREKLAELIKDIECKLDDTKEQCVKDALHTVKCQIKDCRRPAGCCAGPCDFTGVSPTESLEDLAARIVKYRADVAESEKCFDTLIAHISAIPTWVEALKGEVDAIAAQLTAEAPRKEWDRLYARALIAAWKLQDAQLWKGYPTVNAFIDCLCKALECAAKGWEKIVELEGAKAERDCKKDADEKACERKQADMLGEVMKEYVKSCPQPAPDPNGEDGDESDCGCGKDQGQSSESS
jgi:hypothetical protein